MLNNTFKFLLLIYPPILIWNAEEFFILNRVIGITFILLFIIKVVTEKFVVDSKLAKLIFLFLFFILLSSVVKNSFNLINMNILIKYISPFLIGFYTLNYIESKFIKRFITIYFWFFFFTWLIRFAQYGFPFTSVTLIREELWWGKPVVFGLLYSAFYIGYIFIRQETNHKINIIKYLFALPMLFMGCRSVILGAMLILVIYVLNGLRISLRNIKIAILSTIIIGAIANSFLFEYINSNPFLSTFLGSEMDLSAAKEATISSFSSGRTDVWSLYISKFELINIVYGYGGLNFDIGFSLHNDLLEIFFFYGIIPLIIFLVLLYKVYLEEGIKTENALRCALMFFIILQLLFNPFSSTMSASFFIILILNYDYGKFSEGN